MNELLVKIEQKQVSMVTAVLVTVGLGLIMYRLGGSDALAKFQRQAIEDMLKHGQLLST